MSEIILENVYIFIRRVDNNSFRSEITISISVFLSSQAAKV